MGGVACHAENFEAFKNDVNGQHKCSHHWQFLLFKCKQCKCVSGAEIVSAVRHCQLGIFECLAKGDRLHRNNSIDRICSNFKIFPFRHKPLLSLQGLMVVHHFVSYVSLQSIFVTSHLICSNFVQISSVKHCGKLIFLWLPQNLFIIFNICYDFCKDQTVETISDRIALFKKFELDGRFVASIVWQKSSAMLSNNSRRQTELMCGGFTKNKYPVYRMEISVYFQMEDVAKSGRSHVCQQALVWCVINEAPLKVLLVKSISLTFAIFLQHWITQDDIQGHIFFARLYPIGERKMSCLENFVFSESFERGKKFCPEYISAHENVPTPPQKNTSPVLQHVSQWA